MPEKPGQQEHPLANILINVLIPVLALSYLSKDPEFQQAIGALYSVAYDLRFWLKRERAISSAVMPLEGLWWTDGPPRSPAEILGDKTGWHWTLMIAVPDIVNADDVAASRDRAARKRAIPALGRLRLERFAEGLAVQIMHIGPYAAELPTIERLHAFARESGLALRGKHHEIYIGDPNRSKPDNLKTIIRMPVERVPASIDNTGGKLGRPNRPC